MPNQEQYYTLGDVLITARTFLGYLFRKWYLILVGILLGAALGFGIYSLQKPKYIAECTFILEEKQNGLNGLSGLASQFGLDVGGMGGGGVFSGDNILEILTSKAIVQKILLSKTNRVGSNPTLADLYLDFSGLRKKWTSKPHLASVNFQNVNNLTDLSVLQDSVLNIVFEDIEQKHLSAERISKKGTIISTKVVSSNAEFSRLLVERLVAGAKDFYVTLKTAVVASNVSRLQKKADSLSYLLTAKTYQVAQSQINDANPALKMLQVPSEVASRDKTVLLTLYSEVVKNLEMAKTTLMLQTPAIEILDVPSISLYDNKKGKFFFIAIGMFSMLVLTAIILFLQFMNINKRRKMP